MKSAATTSPRDRVERASVGDLVERALDGLGQHPYYALQAAAAIRELAERATKAESRV
jgi:hypothetical protein